MFRKLFYLIYLYNVILIDEIYLTILYLTIIFNYNINYIIFNIT